MALTAREKALIRGVLATVKDDLVTPLREEIDALRTELGAKAKGDVRLEKFAGDADSGARISGDIDDRDRANLEAWQRRTEAFYAHYEEVRRKVDEARRKGEAN